MQRCSRLALNAAKRYLHSNRMPPSAAAATSSALLDKRSFSTAAEENAAATSTAALKPWPRPVVESDGDYRAESYLEGHIGGPLYSRQSSLPRLPVPEVEETVRALIPTCLPLAESSEERESFLRACGDLPSQVERLGLQRRLVDRAEGEMRDSSWLQLWWNTAGYLEVRDPVVVNVSYFFHFSDDRTLPPEPDRLEPGGASSLGVKRGAAMLFAAAEYRRLVCSGALPCETIGRKEPKTPLCSVAFKYMFHACRVPRRGRDGYRMYDPSLRKHAVVTRKGRFYGVDFVDPDTAEPLPLPVIEGRLRQVVELADRAESEGDDVPMLGWLTSSDRDSWADAREEMLRAGGAKAERALEELESGALLLCLDDEEPVSRTQASDLFWTGTLTSGHNRWFDKSIQLFATNNGKAGLLGEHSMMDGMPVVGLADRLTRTTYRDAMKRSGGDEGVATAAAEGVRDIFGSCAAKLTEGDSKVNEMVEKAKSNFTSLISAHSLSVQSFQSYGSDLIKSFGFSPDAYVQMAIQLATYRLWGRQGGTYEATQMRPFLHGRTETTRSVSAESEAFVRRMGPRPMADEDAGGGRKERVELLRAATDAHIQYIGAASKGRGVDRHLLGLAMLIGEGEDAPPLYSHPLYLRSKRWRVSTSHLSHPNFDNWGYGEVVPDGVGLSYGIKPECVVFNITALKEHGWTEQLSHLLEEALLEMRDLNETERGPTSRL